MRKLSVFLLLVLCCSVMASLVGVSYGAVPTRTTQTENLYMRSDTYNVTDVVAYGLDTDYTNTAVYVPYTSASVVNVTYGFRVYVTYSSTHVTELTSGTPVAQLPLTGNFTGQLSSSWNCPETTTILGYEAIEVNVYASANGSAWTSQAIFISNVLITNELQSSNWIFTLQLNMTQTTNTTCGFTFGNTDNRCTIGNIVILEPLQSEKQEWRFNRGDYVGFEIGAYTDLIGSGFYMLILVMISFVLYFRYSNAAIIVFFFAIFGTSTGLVWFLVPPAAAAVVGALLILTFTFLVYRVIKSYG